MINPADYEPTLSFAHSDYHPDYGLVDDFRIKVLHASKRMGVRRAAEAFNVSESTLYRWRRDMGRVIYRHRVTGKYRLYI